MPHAMIADVSSAQVESVVQPGPMWHRLRLLMTMSSAQTMNWSPILIIQCCVCMSHSWYLNIMHVHVYAFPQCIHACMHALRWFEPCRQSRISRYDGQLWWVEGSLNLEVIQRSLTSMHQARVPAHPCVPRPLGAFFSLCFAHTYIHGMRARWFNLNC